MPITPTKNGFNISGIEYQQLELLHQKIRDGQSITKLLEEINPEYLDTILRIAYPHLISLDSTDCLEPVHAAAKYGNLETLKALILKGAKVDTYSTECRGSTLHYAARNNNLDVIDFLVKEQGLKVDMRKNEGDATPLFSCALAGLPHATRKLLSYGANINYQLPDGNTALHYACHYGFMWNKPEAVIETIKILLESGADYRLKGTQYSSAKYTPIEMISDPTHKEAIQKLIDGIINKTHTSKDQKEIKLEVNNINSTSKPIIINPPGGIAICETAQDDTIHRRMKI